MLVSNSRFLGAIVSMQRGQVGLLIWNSVAVVMLTRHYQQELQHVQSSVLLGPRGLSYVLWVYGLLGHNPGKARVSVFASPLSEWKAQTVLGFDFPEASPLERKDWSAS